MKERIAALMKRSTAVGTKLAGRDSASEKWMLGIVIGGLSLAALVSPASGFGFTVGPQIEERMGSEYGSEYYYRNTERCRVVVMMDRKGRRVKVRRCRLDRAG